MEIKKIIDYINRGYIASEYLRAPDIYYYMDLVIDDINERLQAKFPNFSEWSEFVESWNKWVESMPDAPEVPQPGHIHPHKYGVSSPFPLTPSAPDMYIEKGRLLKDNTKYDAFPDKYLRTVVALGVAVKFYTRDEEGEQIALDYQNRYEAALFKMVRDYHNQVPPIFQENSGGFIDFSYNREEGPRNLIPRGVVLRGDDTGIL